MGDRGERKPEELTEKGLFTSRLSISSLTVPELGWAGQGLPKVFLPSSGGYIFLPATDACICILFPWERLGQVSALRSQFITIAFIEALLHRRFQHKQPKGRRPALHVQSFTLLESLEV